MLRDLSRVLATEAGSGCQFNNIELNGHFSQVNETKYENKVIANGFHIRELKQLRQEKECLKAENVRDLSSLRSLAFQKGIIVSINATLTLWAEMKEEGCKYLLTHKLNQDCLENFFSAVRSLGGQDTNPNPVQFFIRIRILKMRRNIEEVINLVKDKDTHVEVAVDEGFEELFVSSEIGMKGDIFSLFLAVCGGQI